MSLRKILVGTVALCAVVLAVVMPACSSDNKLPGAGAGGSGGFGGVATGPCTDGATRKCGIELGKHESVVSCYEGTQSCSEGVWGECANGEVINKPDPGSGTASEGPGNQAQALSPPGNCIGNPCDPYCNWYNETPEGGVSTDATTPIYQWQGGNILDFPSGLVKKGLKQPCQSGSDCQFNTYCNQPQTAPPCTHSKCMTGTGLNPTCDPCVADVCAADPTCCTSTFGTKCWHSPCVQGNKLKSSCDPCVAAICAADSSCCNSWWDSTCVSEVASICGLSCSPGNWQASCVAKVGTVCDAACGTPGASTCAHSVCTVSPTPLNNLCNLCVAQICSVDAWCCSVNWDSICVGEVPSVCGASCPFNMQSPPPEKGQCKEWLPGQKDPSCAGIDLTVDVPCDDTIPVCNHGNTTAPAGIKIVHFPANSNQYPKCNPDLTHPQMQTCTTTAPIPPGQCIAVTGCPGLTGNREIMVNPQGIAGYQTECSCKDNWSLYSGSNACSPPVCAGATTEGAIKKVKMYIQLDRSGSMAGTKWSATSAALTAFFQSPSSAGLNVALEAFSTPANYPQAGNDGCGFDCDPVKCSNPIVPIGTLLASAAPADTQEQKLVQAVAALAPGGNTPTHPALDGAIQWAQNDQLTNPNDVYAVILVTDGEPTACNTDNVAIASLAAAANLGSGIRTYTIAMEGADVAALNQIAIAGGTGSAFVIVGSDIANVSQQLIAALTAIATENVSCNLNLPPVGTFDPADVSATLLPTSGPPVGLPKVANLASCGAGTGAGWYFDNAATPTKVLLCPGSCNAAQTDPGSKIQFNVGCPKQFATGTYTETYEAQCPPGTKPQWGFFAYDSVTPGDSSLVFDARVAVDSASLASAAFVNLATAKATPNTQVCPLTGPSPCPKDLYTLFGLPGAKLPWLELQITSNPTTGGTQKPTLNTWNVTYSCPPAE